VHQVEIVRGTIVRFCQEFLEDPYLCYTERGQHSLFYTMLFNALPEDQRYATFKDRKVCVLQNEYPTAGRLDKPQRQHWDIALLQTPFEPVARKTPAYDHLRLAAAVEFGMNVDLEHLKEDIRRLSHQQVHVRQGFVVHLYRLSPPGKLFSDRDATPRYGCVHTLREVAELAQSADVEIYHGMVDASEVYEQGLWRIRGQSVQRVTGRP
jgi:hypothetical protein